MRGRGGCPTQCSLTVPHSWYFSPLLYVRNRSCGSAARARLSRTFSTTDSSGSGCRFRLGGSGWAVCSWSASPARCLFVPQIASRWTPQAAGSRGQLGGLESGPGGSWRRLFLEVTTGNVLTRVDGDFPGKRAGTSRIPPESSEMSHCVQQLADPPPPPPTFLQTKFNAADPPSKKKPPRMKTSRGNVSSGFDAFREMFVLGHAQAAPSAPIRPPPTSTLMQVQVTHADSSTWRKQEPGLVLSRERVKCSRFKKLLQRRTSCSIKELSALRLRKGLHTHTHTHHMHMLVHNLQSCQSEAAQQPDGSRVTDGGLKLVSEEETLTCQTQKNPAVKHSGGGFMVGVHPSSPPGSAGAPHQFYSWSHGSTWRDRPRDRLVVGVWGLLTLPSFSLQSGHGGGVLVQVTPQ
ncbi:hypothetical protein FQA47_015494 [Oryzias melastigma]|uniref:Uncharacterized protein n=1 Tax=Oryzias melastigma TaxID=30732 RepID=A0A834FQ53_ORYME|nr:hypothetical protein FQA47_015494 [Oryzias melastigma]